MDIVRAAVLGGGGVKGAFELGVLEHLICNLGIRYDMFLGSSVGAINGGFLAQYSKDQQPQGVKDLKRLWFESIKGNKSIYRLWYRGILWKLPLLWKPSIYNSAALQKLIRANLSPDKVKASGIVLRTGAVSYTSGQYREWTEQDDDIQDGVIASSAFPGFLTPPIIDGELWTDGGVQNVIPLSSAIKLGATHIDVVATSPLRPSTLKDRHPNVLTLAKKTVDLMGDEIVREDLEDLEKINQKVQAGTEKEKRFVDYNLFAPTSSLTSDSLDFDPVHIRKMRDVGYLKAWEVMSK